jgi:hypothetical protein
MTGWQILWAEKSSVDQGRIGSIWLHGNAGDKPEQQDRGDQNIDLKMLARGTAAIGVQSAGLHHGIIS